MAEHTILKGLDLPITGQPEQTVSDGVKVTRVAIVGHDYPSMKPRMEVNVGDQVKRGQLLFDDRKSEGVKFTAPGAGTVVEINRGERRAFQSIVIELDEKGDASDQVEFAAYKGTALGELTGDDVRALLGESGLWTALRSRPFSRTPSIGDECHALFVTAVDTNPLAADVSTALAGREEAFLAGLSVVQNLTEGSTFLCVGADWSLDTSGIDGVQEESFVGLHPAGLPGTHIHVLSPVSRSKNAWHVNYQDVAAIGELFTTGQLNPTRVVSLAGPIVTNPRLLRTRLGASIAELTQGELAEDVETRAISGSVLCGHKAQDAEFAYLNRYDNQISCLQEDRERVFFGWLAPGEDKFSVVRAFVSALLPAQKFPFTTTTNGSHRAMVPIGTFERLMPLDIMPTFLLRSLLVSDLEQAERLGCLELHEEDLALCSFASPGKEDFGKALRTVLTEIWEEG
jgi:Na+-transporting NADH:ubiquinone oxidoreductase subunit A